MKKALSWLLVIVFAWIVISKIIFPLAAGVIGAFDKEQELLD
ncbi:MAG: hypothetical protein WC394_02860 [Candidatus Omnitrophota bacterium]|jgi:ABC-type uncharacterized transport system permease subunit